MDRRVGVVVDSTFGLHPDFIREERIGVVPLKIVIDGREYIDGKLQQEQIIEALKNKKTITSVQPSPETFKEAFVEQLKNYDEVLCLTLAKTLSGTYNSATLAKTILNTEKIIILDIETTALQAYYLTQKSIGFLKTGTTAKETVQYIKQLKDQGYLLFTVDNLSTLQKSRSRGNFLNYFGHILKIKPVLIFKNGVIDVIHRGCGFNGVISYLKKQVQRFMVHRKKIVVYIGYIDRSIEAKELEHELFQLGDTLNIQILRTISPVISAYLGPGGLGIYLGYE